MTTNSKAAQFKFDNKDVLDYILNMAHERRKNLSKAIYEIGKFVFSGIVIGFILKFKELSAEELLVIALLRSS